MTNGTTEFNNNNNPRNKIIDTINRQAKDIQNSESRTEIVYTKCRYYKIYIYKREYDV